jgi:flavorubredoxin
VNSRFLGEFVENIRAVMDPSDIDYLFVNHVEPDHSGCLVKTVELVQPEKIFCTAMGKQFMISHYHRDDWPYEVVKTGDHVSLGDKTVQFVELRMLHWPDNLGCYLEPDRLLLSSDAFGHNIATSEHFDDEVGFEAIRPHLANYFANIILPYSGNVLKALEQIEEMGWDIDMIAPDHGLIFRTHVPQVLAAYREFATQQTQAKAVVAFDTMWRSTERMARAVCEGMMGEKISVKVFDLKSCHHSDVMAQVLDAAAVVMGSPTHNQGVLPFVAGLVRYMEGLRPKGKIAAAFGSHGWGQGESVDYLIQAMEGMGMNVVDSVKVKFVPTGEDLERCIAMGKKVASAIQVRRNRATG